MPKNKDKILPEIAEQLHQVHPVLTFEIGPRQNKDEKSHLIISAGGLRSAFHSVVSLVQAAPELNDWKITKFLLARSELGSIQIGKDTLTPEDVYYQFVPDQDPDKIGIKVAIRGYEQSQKNLYGSIAFLYLDQALGEYNVATKIGGIDFLAWEEQSDFEPITLLADAFNRYFNIS